MRGGTRAHHFFLDITFHSLYTFNQLQQNTVAIHEKWKGRIDSWQPRRKPKRKRNTKHESERNEGTRKASPKFLPLKLVIPGEAGNLLLHFQFRICFLVCTGPNT